MNNLLRTLRENQKQNGYHNPDLKRLLAEVKAERKAHDTSKLTEPFYESLEGMLHELRTVTIDNHDAEAFLKPVSRADAPDYHEVIQEPMDLQTMLRKVRQRSYKSKREFKDDLDRIWDNCFQYNAAENHPLRKCATRLKAKAECLLQNLTDRKERSDPVIPPELIPPSKANGVNGHSRTPSSHAIKIPIARRNTPGAGPAKRGGNPDEFPNELAVPRTTDGMAEFKRLDDQFAALDDQFAALDSAIEGKPGSSSAMAERLRELARGAMPLFAPGTKRKLDDDAETPPAKRHSAQEQRELHDLWWQANQKSDVLLGNGLPPITHASSAPPRTLNAPPRGPNAPPRTLNAPPRTLNAPPRRPKKRRPPPHAPPNPKSLLSMMNSNIETVRRMRTVNAKLGALDGEGEALPPLPPGVEEARIAAAERPWRVPTRGGGRRVGGLELGQENADACMNWMSRKALEHAGFQGASRATLDILSGVGAQYLLNVGRTLRFMSDKFGKKMTPEEIILHTLFESGVSEIQDLERYISEDVERFGARMGDLESKLVKVYRDRVTAPEEEVLCDEGLFDEDEEEDELDPLARGDLANILGDEDDYLGLISSGVTADLGVSRLTVPRRLMRGKKARPVVPTEARLPEEDNPHAPPPPFVPLDSNSVDDQIGLLRPYYQERMRSVQAPAPAAPAIPSLPGPRPLAPPPLTVPAPLLPPPLPGPVMPNALPTSVSLLPPPVARPALPPPSPTHPVVLPDDEPSSAQSKIGALGQITRNAPPKKAEVAAARRAEKERAKGGGPGKGTAAAASPAADTGGKKRKGEGEDGQPAKKRKNMGIGSGNWKRKKSGEPRQPQQGQQGGKQGQGQQMAYPAPVVAASA